MNMKRKVIAMNMSNIKFFLKCSFTLDILAQSRQGFKRYNQNFISIFSSRLNLENLRQLPMGHL
jgi:hypothetical protein